MADENEQSYPSEEVPLPASAWRSVTLGIGNGVLDEGGAPYRLINIDNVNNRVTVAVDSVKKYAHAILGGFYHKITANKTLDIPAVSRATTYYVALQLDPIRATTGDLPMKLDVFTALDRTSDKDYLVLHRIVRRPDQLLTDATFTKCDVKIAPQIMVDEFDSLPDPASVLWGTTCIVRLPHEVIYQSRGDSSGRIWLKILDTQPPLPTWEELGDTATYVYPGHGARRALLKDGNTRKLRGRIARKSGENFNTGNPNGYLMMSLVEADRPRYTQAFTTTTSGQSNPGYARVEISAGSGEVRAWTAVEASWISLDGIVFDID